MWGGGHGGSRRESNCLTTLKVLEMICDLFQVCALGGKGTRDVTRKKATELEGEMSVANGHFLPLWGHA